MRFHQHTKTETAWIADLPHAFQTYLGQQTIEEVECIIPDLVGISRGKAMPSYKFSPHSQFRLPISLFYQTISGQYVDMDIDNQWTEEDVTLIPDMTTASAVPWAKDPTLQVICDMVTKTGDPLNFAPRNVLRRVLGLYDAKNWVPIIGPELEFYLITPNTDPNESIRPPLGRTGRQGGNRQAFSMAAIDEYGPVIDTIYDFAEMQGLAIDTLIQEGGAGQIEINLLHGDPLSLADQVFYFKRAIREAALKHDMFATFMAKPMRDEPGSAMHLHQSVLDKRTGKNIFTDDTDKPSQSFIHHIGGLQKYLMHSMPLIAPYVNSYRRITLETASAPTNLEWAIDNRTTGLRVPNTPPQTRHIENRVIGMDCNPYLAIATSLACGYLGMVNKLDPRPVIEKEVGLVEESLPESLGLALDLFENGHDIQAVLGDDFCKLFLDIKRAENEEYQREISPWERQHLLLNA